MRHWDSGTLDDIECVAKAMVFLSQQEVSKVQLKTPWGIEEAIRYLGRLFLPTNEYTALPEALTACRRDLDAGLLSIVVAEQNVVRLWCLVPRELTSKEI
ncbi:MAG: hypothetical protein HC919_02615 [Oscillatoriales cyanobacterium SM2_2_1]|nr:hypothetical protein [Oscillatoriales cyanobacterium SM2_2_1]